MANKTVYRQGFTEFDGRAFEDYAVRKTFKFTDLASNIIRIPIEAGKTLLEVRLHVIKAFSGATSAKVGDSASDSGFLTATDLTQTLVRTDNFVISSAGKFALTQSGTTPFAVTLTPNAYAAGGKHYPNGDFVIVTFAGTLTAGQAAIDLVYKGYDAPRADMINNY